MPVGTLDMWREWSAPWKLRNPSDGRYRGDLYLWRHLRHKYFDRWTWYHRSISVQMIVSKDNLLIGWAFSIWDIIYNCCMKSFEGEAKLKELPPITKEYEYWWFDTGSSWYRIPTSKWTISSRKDSRRSRYIPLNSTHRTNTWRQVCFGRDSLREWDHQGVQRQEKEPILHNL